MDFLFGMVLFLVQLSPHMLCSYEKSMMKYIILGNHDGTSDIHKTHKNYSLSNHIIEKTGLNTGNIATNSKTQYVPIKYNVATNSIDYFELNLSKTKFDVTVHEGSGAFNYKQNNISLIALTNSIERESLTVVYSTADRLVQLLNFNYSDSPISISNKTIGSGIIPNKNKQVKYFHNYLIALSNDDIFTIVKENLTIKLKSLIKIEQCFVMKIINFESFIYRDQPFLIILFTYLCADLDFLSIKLAHVLVDLQKDNVYRVRHIHTKIERQFDGVDSAKAYFSEKTNVTTKIVLDSVHKQAYIHLQGDTHLLVVYANKENVYEPYIVMTDLEDVISSNSSNTAIFPIFHGKMFHLLNIVSNRLEIVSLSTHVLLRYNLPYYYYESCHCELNPYNTKQICDHSFFDVKQGNLINISRFLDLQKQRINVNLKEKISSLVIYMYYVCFIFIGIYFII